MAAAADWPQWRGPDRNGVAPQCPPLADSWPKNGPPQLWHSEQITSKETGGQGSVVVAGGRAYLYCSKMFSEAIQTRKIGPEELKRLGWMADVPDDVLAGVEKARTADDRTKLKDKELAAWIEKWISDNLPEAQRKKFGPFAQQRINAGAKAMPWDVLQKLSTIRGQEFETQAKLDEWFDANKIDEAARKQIMAVVPTTKQQARDIVYCLDAASGKTLWKSEFPGRPYQWGVSGTPLVTGDRVYVCGAASKVYCLNAKTGETVWSVQSQAGAGKSVSSSFLLVDGTLVALAGPLTAFDPADGKVLWSQQKVEGENPSASLWTSGGKTWLICNSNQGIACVDPKTGDVKWTVPGGGSGTAAVEGDMMVLLAQDPKVGLCGYRMSADKAEKLWSLPWADRGCTPVILKDSAYLLGGSHLACVELSSGKVAWDQKAGGEISSPIIADGKVIAVGDDGASLTLCTANPEKLSLLARVRMPIAQSSSPAVADGKLYLRLRDGVACYDLGKSAVPATNP